ncbi:biotin synthase BioB [Micromonospora sp. NBC_00421]|uniref:biotin synthase BioB n=1 Tax=Micromonospora sp. NBC_00421 TaxID=2975976 RepID=UPI002E1A1B47
MAVSMLSTSEIRAALDARGSRQQELFAEARRLRDKHFARSIVLRGVIEVTNVCRVNCDYCPMRRDNTRYNDRYFMSSDEIVQRAREIHEAGIDVILLQGGEAPRVLAAVKEAIAAIKELYGGRVEVLLNLGSLTRDQYSELRQAGATSYILKHETSDAALHEQVRGETLESRLESLRDLLDLGYKVGTGFISDLPGQRIESIVDDIELAGRLGVHMCSVSPFAPAPDTPLADQPSGSLDLALNSIACLRICYPHLLIPSVSALEKADSGGQARGLEAGANVLTINFTAESDRQRYLIYGKNRFVVRMQHVQEIVRNAGLGIRGSIFLPDGAGRPA